MTRRNSAVLGISVGPLSALFTLLMLTRATVTVAEVSSVVSFRIITRVPSARVINTSHEPFVALKAVALVNAVPLKPAGRAATTKAPIWLGVKSGVKGTETTGSG